MTETTLRDGSHDFDFFVGNWNVHHRVLRSRLTNCTEWDEYEGTCFNDNIMGGQANFDESAIDRPAGRVNGMTLRLYNQESREWSLYWAATGSAIFDVPMIGSFKDKNDLGEFYAQETHKGQHVYSRFIWSRISDNFCQWEQALSTDGGKTWETNWIMEHTRMSS
ncbi:MAG: hypothetical protein ABI970_24875 [Chloroflexota bacterium]